MSLISAAEFLNVRENPALKKEREENATRQHMMRRIGVFELIDGEYVGHIATLGFNCKAVIRENPYRKATTDAEYVVEQVNAEVFHSDLGFAWEKATDGLAHPYLAVHLDDPSFAKTIVAVLVKAHGNMYYLYWDRVTITDGEIDKFYVQDELTPYTGVLRPIDRVTDYLISIYPSLQEIWDPD